MSGTVFGASTTLIPAGSTWKYLDKGTDQGTAWRGTNFNDTGWASGPAELGYGDGGEATVVSYGSNANNKYITTYFRCAFVSASTNYSVLQVNLKRDDGAIVYLNGTEVIRTNLAAGAVNYLTLAANATDDGGIFIPFQIVPSALVAGTNVVAVEIHQTSVTSSDISFDMELLGLTGLVRGPYLQAATTTGICVMAECVTTNPVTVEYGLTLGYGGTAQTTATAATTAGTPMHMVKLTGLQPNTLYHYRVSTGDTNSADATFRTLVVPGTDFWFAWMADCRSPGMAIHDAISARIATANPLFSLYGGDLCDTNAQGGYSAYVNEFFRPNELALIATVPFYNTVGNHETWGQNTQAFTEAPPSTSGTEAYYSFDCGDMHVLVMNFMLGYAPGSAQYNFATNDLATTTKTWKIVTCHEPAYVVGGNHTPSADIKNLATNCFEKVGVDMMFSGHTHFFEHILTNSVHYFIVGSAGAELKVPASDPSVVASASSYCYAVADVTYTNLNLVVYNELGSVLDTLNLSKPPSPAALGFLSQSTSTHAGATFTLPVQVAVMDIKGNTNVPAAVTVALGSNPSGGTLFGMLTASTVSGVAIFSNLQIDKMGTGYTLVATVGGLSATSAVFNVLFTDRNTNDIADNWEMDYFGSTNAANGAAGADWDRDGFSNLQEFIAGTNPTNTGERFNINIIATNGQVMVSFSTLPAASNYLAGFSRHYSLEVCTNLSSGGWSAVSGFDDIIGAGQTVTHTNQTVGTPKFYRARTWLRAN